MTLCSLDWHRASRAAVFRMNSNPTPIFSRAIAVTVISEPWRPNIVWEIAIVERTKIRVRVEFRDDVVQSRLAPRFWRCGVPHEFESDPDFSRGRSLGVSSAMSIALRLE